MYDYENFDLRIMSAKLSPKVASRWHLTSTLRKLHEVPCTPSHSLPATVLRSLSPLIVSEL